MPMSNEPYSLAPPVTGQPQNIQEIADQMAVIIGRMFDLAAMGIAAPVPPKPKRLELLAKIAGGAELVRAVVQEYQNQMAQEH